MNSKPTLSALLIFTMLAATACTDIGTPSETTGEATSTEPEVTTAPAEYQNPGVNYEDQTITIASYSYSTASQITKYNILLDEENGDKINDAIVERNRKVEDELGVNLELTY